MDAVNRYAIERFVAERNEAVWSFSVPKFRNYVKKYFPEKVYKLNDFSRMQLKGIMAKMCFQITGTPDEVLADAIRILNKLKWSADMFGKDDVL